MQVTRHLLPSTALVLSVALTTAAAPQTPPKQAVAKGTSSQLKVTVNAVAVATKFVAYLGGRTNISPPDTVRGGEGVPLISFSDKGPAFMAGEVGSKDEKTKLIKVTFTVTNAAQEPASFKIGDVRLVVGADRSNDFTAVGYDSKLCAMSDPDRKRVKEIVVTIPPAGARRLSYAFPLLRADAKRAELAVGSSTPVPFDINGK
ncbi:MAG: hypothetical protein DMG41_19605 [Acidobacteria bacterium]|nr:MAG: hypothetical protein DMG42_26880 [Acidobacteriota bacterium]PYT86530.1 MAG: hypothetical protein DMG41_19605 [Acidobacteriota bacterium]